MFFQGSGKGDNHIGDDIGHTNIAHSINMIQQVSLLNGNGIVYLVMLYILNCDPDGIRIDVNG